MLACPARCAAVGAALARRLALHSVAPLPRAFGAAAPGRPAVPATTARPAEPAAVCRAYSDPEIYDIAFSFRQYDQEVWGACGVYVEPREPWRAVP